MKHLGVVTLCSILAVGVATAADREKQERTLTSQGQGKVSIVPDIARISVEVSDEGAELDPILTGVRKDMTKVLDAMKGQGIPEKDIQTELFQVRPKFENDKRGNQRRAGFVVTNRASVKIRDIKKTGKVLSVALNSGANAVNGPDFEVDNPAEAERQALAAATKDAKAKAQAVAEAAGVTLGEIISINPQTLNWPMPKMYAARAMMAMEGAAAEPIAGGEQTLSAQATITFAIR